jgi:hypothetical protein
MTAPARLVPQYETPVTLTYVKVTRSPMLHILQLVFLNDFLFNCQGKKWLVLGLVWQVIKLYLFNQVMCAVYTYVV